VNRSGADGAGLRFECTGCGDCCRVRGEYAHVYLNTEELRALADLLGISVRRFKRRYTFVDEDGWRQLAFEGKRCIFLEDETDRCTVYQARPTQCRTFPFWRELVDDGTWTRQARSICEGVGCGRLHSILEVESRMADMELSERG
jgi:Fe-S-cluster containining protein